jgi:hypothetical protein
MRLAGHTDLKDLIKQELERRKRLREISNPVLDQMYAYYQPKGQISKVWVSRNDDLLDFEALAITGKRITGRMILLHVMAKRGVGMGDLTGKYRNRDLAIARHEAMYLMRVHTDKSYPEIGKLLNRDHTTVLAGIARHLVRHRLPPLPEHRTDRYRQFWLKHWQEECPYIDSENSNTSPC